MTKRRLLLVSTSKLYNCEYLSYIAETVKAFFADNNCKNVLFVPYAVRDHAEYTAKVRTAFSKIDLSVQGMNEVENPVEAVKKAEGIFIGGGNTFLLLKTLYDLKLVEAIRERCLIDGIPYMGSSAGTNVATASISTTNDMPIVWPPSLNALKLVPFNINPHYLDADPNSTHAGETRETRITEYLENCTSPVIVLGLYEGSYIEVIDDKAILHGVKGAKLFKKCNEPPESLPDGQDISYLLKTPL